MVDNILVILTSIFCLIFFLVVRVRIKQKKEWFRRIVLRYKYVLHPNAITIGGAVLAIVAMFLYHFKLPHLAIVLFIIAASTDALDGMVARATGLVTDIGKELDPLCDKIRYLLPLIYFAQTGLLFGELVFSLVLVDIFGQFSRRLVDFANEHFGLKIAIAANKFGKIKTVLALFLVVYCFLLLQESGVPNLANEILTIVFCLAMLSVIFKFNKKIAVSGKTA